MAKEKQTPTLDELLKKEVVISNSNFELNVKFILELLGDKDIQREIKHTNLKWFQTVALFSKEQLTNLLMQKHLFNFNKKYVLFSSKVILESIIKELEIVNSNSEKRKDLLEKLKTINKNLKTK